MFDTVGILSEINIVKLKEKRWNCDSRSIVLSMVSDVTTRSALMSRSFRATEILCNTCIWRHKCWRTISLPKANHIANAFRTGTTFKKILCTQNKSALYIGTHSIVHVVFYRVVHVLTLQLKKYILPWFAGVTNPINIDAFAGTFKTNHTAISSASYL